MTPDPAFLFQTPSNREVLAALAYGVLEEKGFITVIGDAGTGKTTVLSRMLRTMPRDRVAFSLVLNPTLTTDEFLESAMVDFGIHVVPPGKLQRLVKLQQFLSIARRAGRICVLVVDEAHKLSTEVLEEIRLLTNFENAEHKLLQIVLAGQLELRDVLNAQELRQLKQRIAVRCQLQPLSGTEVVQYLQFRWATAGGTGSAPFESEAVQYIAEASGGIPRVINALCDNALTLVLATGDARVSSAHIHHVARDLDIDSSGAFLNSSNSRSNSRNGASPPSKVTLVPREPLRALTES